MAHWAEIDNENKVLRVIVTDNNEPKGDEGYAWILKNLGGIWVQTSYNSSLRKNYAGVGFTYDAGLDAFLPPQPFSSWLLNQETAQWQAPVPMPEGDYRWDEDSLNWLEVKEV